jgi:hypothetical protein
VRGDLYCKRCVVAYLDGFLEETVQLGNTGRDGKIDSLFTDFDNEATKDVGVDLYKPAFEVPDIQSNEKIEVSNRIQLFHHAFRVLDRQRK